MDEDKSSGIKIRAPKYHRKEGVGGIHKFLQSSFCTLIVGKPGSGKSHLLYELITNPSMYFKKFNKVLFCTPTKMPLEFGDDNWKPYLDLPWLYGILTKLPPGSNAMVVLDDVIGEIKKEQTNPMLMKLFFNRRHIIPGEGTVNIILTTQKYIVCPTRIRSCLTGLILFKLNPTDWRKVKEECLFVDKAEAGVVIKEAYKKSYDFCYIRLDNGDVYNKFENKLL